MKARNADQQSFRRRLTFAFALLAVGAVGLAARAVELQLLDHEVLADRGDERSLRVQRMPAHRGTIVDRNGEPLAVSRPVESVYAVPKALATQTDQLPQLAKALKRDRQDFVQRLTSRLDRKFIYLARHVSPAEAAAVRKLDVPGVMLAREYRRYYPAGEVTGHVLGFTSIDDRGLEGTEFAFDPWLAGESGSKRVIQDRMGRQINVESIKATQQGRELALSIDLRIQYLAYRELKAAIQSQRARSGSIVMIDVTTGEVLAMVNQPTYNPNDRDKLTPKTYRNRAATDILEPGSSIKPFVIAAALASGKYQPDSIVDTSPGFIAVGAKMIQDEHPIGAANLATILAKSSNVGMTKIALSLKEEQIWSTLTSLGFGQVTASGFPGESAGLLSNYKHWRAINIATLSYGYGLSVTPLQLAQAYATIGAFGVARPVSLLKVDGPVPGRRVLDERVGRSLVRLLEAVVVDDGATGVRAAIPGYRVAGKTGTARIAASGGYDDRHVAVFGGVAPATNPRLAAVVVIDDPGAGKYYASDIAAPVFSAVMGGALRFLAVAPDDTIDERADPLTGTQTLVQR